MRDWVKSKNSTSTWGEYSSTLSTLVFNNTRGVFASATESTWLLFEPQTSILSKSCWISVRLCLNQWGMVGEKQNLIESGIQNLNTESTTLSNPSATTTRLWLHWAAAQKAFTLCYSLDAKGLKHFCGAISPDFHPAYFNTCSSIYFTSASAAAKLLRRQACTTLESRSELCYSLHSINVQGSVLLALDWGRTALAPILLSVLLLDQWIVFC